MITNVQIAGGFDPRTIALLTVAIPDFWDDIPFDTNPAVEAEVAAGAKSA